jgi:hypothetical protein
MTLPKFALDYKTCSIAELSGFIKARTGQDIAGIEAVVNLNNVVDGKDLPSSETLETTTVMLEQLLARRGHIKGKKTRQIKQSLAKCKQARDDKGPYIARLQSLDKAAKFRFFDIPGELRNAIYGDLLVPSPHNGKGSSDPCPHSEGNRSCWPSILRACKATHEEGRGFLYDESNISISIWTREWELPPAVAYNGCRRLYPLSETAGLDHRMFEWHPMLLKVETLRLSVEMGYDFAESLEAINLALWHLSYILLKEGRAKEVRLKVSTSAVRVVDVEDMKQCLQPARLLAPKVMLETCPTVGKYHGELADALVGVPRETLRLREYVDFGPLSKQDLPFDEMERKLYQGRLDRYERLQRPAKLESWCDASKWLEERLLPSCGQEWSLTLLWLSAALAGVLNWNFMTLERDQCLQRLLLFLETRRECIGSQEEGTEHEGLEEMDRDLLRELAGDKELHQALESMRFWDLFELIDDEFGTRVAAKGHNDEELAMRRATVLEMPEKFELVVQAAMDDGLVKSGSLGFWPWSWGSWWSA